jgi:hypothetical protein
MKLNITRLLTLAFLISAGSVTAQDWEFGLFVGPAQYQGDLSRAQITWPKTRLQGGAIARYNLTPKISFKGGVYFGRVTGADAAWGGSVDDYKGSFVPGLADHQNKSKAGQYDELSNNYYRYKRNLSFKSNILEISGAVEYNIFNYIPGSKRYKWTPYITAGIGYFHYNPKTEYKGQTVVLKNVATEEGKTYKGNALCIPMGFGIKYNLKSLWSISFEIVGRKTNTDWLDDVHQNYAGPNATPGSLAVALSDRSVEVINPKTGANFSYSAGNEPWRHVAGPNEEDKVMRGDPRDMDTYIFTGFTLSKTIRKYGCTNF